MKGEIYDLHNRQLSLIREIQRSNPNLILGGALGLKVQGIRIPNVWYSVYFYTNELYKLKGEDKDPYFTRAGECWNKICHINDEKYTNSIRVFQKREDDIEVLYSKYLGFPYRVVHPTVILAQYARINIVYHMGLIEFRTAFENKEIKLSEDKWEGKYIQHCKW